MGGTKSKVGNGLSRHIQIRVSIQMISTAINSRIVFDNRIAGASVAARTAIGASLCFNHVDGIANLDRSHGTLRETDPACLAKVGDLTSHENPHSAKVARNT